MNKQELQATADRLNVRHPSLNATVNISKFGGHYVIDVATVDKAKALNEMYLDISFTSGAYA